MAYVDPDVIDDEGAVAEAILAAIADQIPGWEPSEGHVETALGEAMAVVAATIAVLLKDEARDVYSGFAQSILGLARRTEDAATALSDWTMRDDAGYVIPDGTQLFIRDAAGETHGFATVGDVTVPATQTTALGVRVEALEAGSQANGLTGAVAAFDPVLGVAGVVLSTISRGGSDLEDLDAFLARAVDRARRLRAVPITADDFAALALDQPDVARAMAVNLLDLDATPTWTSGATPDAGGHISVFCVDTTGNAISGDAAAEVVELLAGDDRPLNVLVHVGDPTFTRIDVAITIRILPEADPVSMRSLVEAAIVAYLDPAQWAADPDEPGRWRAPAATGDRTVRHFDVAHIAEQVPGVTGVVACTLNGGTSVTLGGWAPLPQPGEIAVTVGP
jgi:uncharacterized phage protein gp47/JayE